MVHFLSPYFNKKNNFIIAIIVCFLAFLLLSACSLFEPIKIPPTHYFTLAIPDPNGDCPLQRGCRTILVNQPRVNAVYNTSRMIYIPACYQIQYFAQNRWVGTPAEMLHPLLINALQHTGYFQAIINTPSTTDYDWVLNTQLLSFQQEFIYFPSRFRIAIRAQLIDARSRHILATQDFVAVEIAPHDDPYGGTLAANSAIQKILNEINCFCLKNLYIKN
ncbi:ABC transporter [Rickettsiella grylli]|uniref:ABC-type transport auxiliary lipoprotein family protein n=1 Tax=Rickettsiella grylli TaxID=59196 RepID=UPI0008FD85F2|nr:ABC-type transport auxiliary lipoprotein family protein [Rickettsiella grylli]OIZ99572.1 ABC transporter [Rickettsiella grylli]